MIPRSLRNESSAGREADVRIQASIVRKTVAAMAEPRQFHHLLARVSRPDLRANWVHLARRAIHVTGFKGVVFAVIPARHTSCFAHTRRCLMRSPRSPIDDAWLQGALADTDALLRSILSDPKQKSEYGLL